MITIGMAEDHSIVRETLCLLLSKMKDTSVLMKTQNGYELLVQIQKAKIRPSIVFLDVHMPLMDGVATSFYIRTHFPKIHVIAFSHYSHYLVVQDMFDAGANAFIIKDNITESLLSSVISSVLSKIPFLDPTIELNHLITIPEKISISESANMEINKMERTFLQLLATAISIEQIALLMNLAISSIYNYQKSLKLKIGLSSRQELSVYALQHDIARIARFKTLKSTVIITDFKKT